MKSDKKDVEAYCPMAGRRNSVTFALSKYNELMGYQRAREARQRAAAHPAPPPPPEPKYKLSTMPDFIPPREAPATCKNIPSNTAWCRSDNPIMGQRKQCFETAQMNAPDNYVFELKLECDEPSYLAVIATYDDTGHCTRSVVTVAPRSSTTAQVGSSLVPKVLDAISSVASSDLGASSQALQACYRQRHDGCSCD